jgi:hypothetical protein
VLTSAAGCNKLVLWGENFLQQLRVVKQDPMIVMSQSETNTSKHPQNLPVENLLHRFCILICYVLFGKACKNEKTP